MRKSRPEVAGDLTNGGRKRPLAADLVPRHIDIARADVIRRAVASSATELLRSLIPDRSIPKVLQKIGAASRVSRVQLYESERQPDGGVSQPVPASQAADLLRHGPLLPAVATVPHGGPS